MTTNRRTFLASISALLVPVALVKRDVISRLPVRAAEAAPDASARSAAEADFRRYRALATRAQSRAATTLDPLLDR